MPSGLKNGNLTIGIMGFCLVVIYPFRLVKFNNFFRP